LLAFFQRTRGSSKPKKSKHQKNNIENEGTPYAESTALTPKKKRNILESINRGRQRSYRSAQKNFEQKTFKKGFGSENGRGGNGGVVDSIGGKCRHILGGFWFEEKFRRKEK